MATYASLNELKAFLHVEDDAKDALLTMILESAESAINNYIGVSTVTRTTVKERIKVSCDGTYILWKGPVVSISKINGQTYTGVNGTDYVIEHKRILNIRDIDSYLIGLKFDSFEIEYSAGYDRVPNAIKMAELMYAGAIYGSSGSNGAYASYAIGDEKVVFKTKEEQDGYTALLKPYKLYK